MRKRYEYTSVFYDIYSTSSLDKAGKDGWRVVQNLGRDDEGDSILLLEREVEDDAQSVGS